MTAEIVLYTNPQSRGRIVHWMLEEIGCPYRIECLGYGPPMKSPDYLAINPMGKVPALRHGETVVTESLAILAYLADVFPEAGLAPPQDRRGDYYRWLFFVAACVEPAMMNHSVGWDPETPELQGRFGYGSYQLALDVLASAVAGKAFIVGGRFSAADIAVASLLNWGMFAGLIARRPEFETYCAGLKARPAALRVIEQSERMTA